MGKTKAMGLLVWVLILALLAACSPSLDAVVSSPEQMDGSQSVAGTAATEAAGSTADAPADAAAGNRAGTVESGTGSVAEALAENSQAHADAVDDVWDRSGAVQIDLQGDSIAVQGEGVVVDGSRATITAAGTYSLQGRLDDGQIRVDTQATGIVRLVLNGVDLHNTSSAAIYIARAEETVIVLADDVENSVSDGESYLFDEPEQDEPNAAIFSKGDLTIAGDGSLTVDGNYNDGIASKDGLVIASGTITVRAVDDGIRGKDYLVVRDGTVSVTAQGDGLKADNEEDASKGYILIQDGRIEVTSGGDAIEAQTDVLIADGEITITSGGGSTHLVGDTGSAKGIKGLVRVALDGGTYTLDCADDAIHSNGSVTINNGTFLISTGDDAIHADTSVEINGGEITITDCYEGVESAAITINAGELDIVASDDGLNVAAGNDESGFNRGPGPGGRPGPPGWQGQDAFAASGDTYLHIHGGRIVIDADGDGMDINGAIEMTAGVVLISGPTERMNGALDYDAWFTMQGGFLVAAGSSGMAQAPSDSSTQYSVLLNLGGTLPGGTLFRIQTSDGQEILTFSPAKDYQSIVLSSPDLSQGPTYEVYYGGHSSGSVQDGLYSGGTYTSGTDLGSFTLSGMVTWLGDRAR